MNNSIFKSVLIPMLLIISSLNNLNAQTKISGKTLDNSNKGIPGVNIFVKGSYDGTSSDANGNYSFVANDTGTATIVASVIGFETVEYQIHLDKKDIVYNPVLKEIINQLKVVTISAGAIEASDEKKVTVLKPLDIVTTANAAGDIYGALKTLPGAQQASESEGLFVRGGTGNETKTIIDGMEVPHPYFSGAPDIAARGRFSPFLFKGTVFSTGGYSAQYGDAMSSALILESQDLPDVTASTIALSSVGLGVGHNHLFDSKNTSVGFDANYTNLAPYFSLVKQDEDWYKMPLYYGGSLNFRTKTSKTGILKFYGYFNSGSIGILENNLDSLEIGHNYQDSFELKNTDIYTNATYKEYLGENWRIYIGTSYSKNNDNIKISGYPITKEDDWMQGKLMFTRYIGKLSVLRFGGEVHQMHDNFNVPYFSASINDLYSAAIIESDIYFTTKLVARLGLREENSQFTTKSDLAPRASLAYKTGEFSQVSFAYGDFYQLPIDTLLYHNPHLDYEKATHYILNYQHVDDDRTFRVEGYYKSYQDLVKIYPTDVQSYPLYSNAGYGYAKGIDVFLRDKKDIKNVDFWISYTYLDTKRDFLNFPSEATPNFASKHTASIVYKEWVGAIKTYFGITYTYASGRPYYNVNNPIFPDNYPSSPGSMTPSFNSVGANASYLTHINGWYSVIVFAVGNVLGNSNIYTYRYSADGTYKQEVTSPALRTFFVGLFMSIGTDRSKEVVNNN